MTKTRLGSLVYLWINGQLTSTLLDLNRNVSHVIDEEVFCLTCEDARLFPDIQKEADTYTMFILHCLNMRISLSDASTIIVTSKVTRHRCISTTCMILQGYTLDRFVQHWCGQQKAPSEYQQQLSEYGGSTQPYTVSQAVTLPVCLCLRKVAPIKLMENPSHLVDPNSKQGREREKLLSCTH